jgi:predicted CXXCH cytochrome family protein
VTRVDHADVIGTCFSCHNGTVATGKSANHIASSNTCDDCHTTNTWSGAVFDHSSITGNCASCHNGTTATGKNAQHIQTNNLCEDCHRTTAWIPVTRVDHNDVLGSCSNCHNGTQATGKPGNHFGTTLQCDTCHQTTNWTTLVFRHSSPSYPGDHSGNPPCTACHQTNSETVTWTAPGYQPDCAGCHASDYKPGNHQNWSVSQNRNCAGTCHRNSPEHSVRDREW